jgi:TP901 family phage tail tape measure protein
MDKLKDMLMSPKAFGIGVVVTLGAIAAAALHAAVQWNNSFAGVQKRLQGTTEEINHVQDALLEIASTRPLEESGLTTAFSTAWRSGIRDSAKALFVVEKAADAAVASQSDINSVMKTGAAILRAWGMEAEKSGEIYDKLVVTTGRGQVTFDELGDSIGTLAPLFAEAGLSLDDLLATIATLTGAGVPLSNVLFALRTTIAGIIKPSKQAQQTAKELGISFDGAAIAAQGFVPWLQDLMEKAGGDDEALAKLFKGARGLGTMLALTGKQSEAFVENLDAIKNSGGTVAEQMDVVSATWDAQSKILKNKLNHELILLGNNLLGPVLKGFNVLTGTHFDGLAQDMRNIKGVKDQLAFLSGEATNLARRYSELVQQGMTIDESQELADIVKKLSDAYPELIDQTDQFGNATGIAADRVDTLISSLKEYLRISEFETSRKQIEGLANAYKDAADAAEMAVRMSGAIARIRAQEGKPGRQPSEDLFGGTRMEQFQHRLRDSIDDAAKYRQEIEEMAARYADYLKLVDSANDVANWITLRKEMFAASDAGQSTLEIQQHIDEVSARLAERGLLGDLTTLDKLPGLLDKIASKMQFPQSPMDLRTPDYTATVPIPPGALEAAHEAFAKSRAGAEAELQKFVEHVTGRKFFGEQFKEFLSDEDLKQFYTDWIEKDKKAAEERIKNEEEVAKKREEAVVSMYEVIAMQQKNLLTGNTADVKKMLAEIRAGEFAGFAGPSLRELQGLTIEPGKVKGFDTKDLEESLGRLHAIMGDTADAMVADFGVAMSKGEDVSKLLAQIPEGIRKKVIAILQTLLASATVDPETRQKIEDALAGLTDERKNELDQVENLTRGLMEMATALGVGGAMLPNFVSATLNMASALEAGGSTLTLVGAAVGVIGTAVSMFSHENEVFVDRVQNARKALEDFNDSLHNLSAKDLSDKQRQMAQLAALLQKYNREAQVGNRDAVAALYAQIKTLLHTMGIELPEGLANLGEFVRGILGGWSDFLDNIGKMTGDTFADVVAGLQYQFGLLDIEDPAQKLAMFLEALKKFTSGTVDLTGLIGKTPEEIGKAMELIGKLITGIVPGLHGEPKGKDFADAITEIGRILGMSLTQVMDLLMRMINGQLTTQELQDLINSIEGIGDDMKNAVDKGAKDTQDQISISRNVSITEDQGRTLIGLSTTSKDLLRAILDEVKQLDGIGGALPNPRYTVPPMSPLGASGAALEAALENAFSAALASSDLGNGGDTYEVNVNIQGQTATGQVRTEAEQGVSAGMSRIQVLRRSAGISRRTPFRR